MKSELALKIENVSKSFMGEKRALDSINLEIYRGEFFTLLGPSGCGKSTLLRIIMGIETLDYGGVILLNGENIEMIPVQRRNISMVFQSYALFPHMNVLKNIKYGLKMKKISSKEADKRVGHAVDITHLNPYLKRMPRHLSGGQQQRVALARAIVMHPDLLLLDEPLSNLDAKLRESLREDLLILHRKSNSTSIYVTHDQNEAMSMSDRVAVMSEGRIVEMGTPQELYRSPKYKYTAQFLGQANIIEVEAKENQGITPWGERIEISGCRKGLCDVFIRPEEVAIVMNPKATGTTLGVVKSVSFFGSSIEYELEVDSKTIIKSMVNGHSDLLKINDQVGIKFNGRFRILENDPQ